MWQTLLHSYLNKKDLVIHLSKLTKGKEIREILIWSAIFYITLISNLDHSVFCRDSLKARPVKVWVSWQNTLGSRLTNFAIFRSFVLAQNMHVYEKKQPSKCYTFVFYCIQVISVIIYIISTCPFSKGSNSPDLGGRLLIWEFFSCSPDFKHNLPILGKLEKILFPNTCWANK